MSKKITHTYFLFAITLLSLPAQLRAMENQVAAQKISIDYDYISASEPKPLMDLATDIRQSEQLRELILETLAQNNQHPNIQAHILATRAECYLFGCNGYSQDLSKFYEIAMRVIEMKDIDSMLLEKLKRDIALLNLLSQSKITRNDCSGNLEFSDARNGFLCHS